MSIIVTGGAGFIGSNFINEWIKSSDESVINLDKLTYSGNLNNFIFPPDDKKHFFVKGDIQDRCLLSKTFKDFQPRAIIHFAAESHVDRSIHGPEDFMQANIIGTYKLLEEAKLFYNSLNNENKNQFRFLHISTDEVYGALSSTDAPFKETNQYKPNSPYSASKAASDHLVRAWHHTYNLPVLSTNCSNNYGPYHFPEKLIPLCILKAINGENLPIYGDGQQIRDWLYVIDHCKGIKTVLDKGKIGETYNIGGRSEKTNLEVVETLCLLLDELKPRDDGKSYKEQITFVKDRPGHDRRYAIDVSKISDDLGWNPEETFETGIRKTVEWYLKNQEWVEQVQSGNYKNWLAKNYI